MVDEVDAAGVAIDLVTEIDADGTANVIVDIGGTQAVLAAKDAIILGWQLIAAASQADTMAGLIEGMRRAGFDEADRDRAVSEYQMWMGASRDRSKLHLPE